MCGTRLIQPRLYLLNEDGLKALELVPHKTGQDACYF